MEKDLQLQQRLDPTLVEEPSWREERDRLMADITRLTLGETSRVVGESSGAGKVKPNHAPVLKTLSGSIQKKFNEQYNIYLKNKEGRSLTPNQALDFVECLGQVRKNIEERSEKMKRRYWIKKALLMKNAKNNNINHLSHEVYKMETEAAKLQGDYDAYNAIQAEFKLAPAYIKMTELYEERKGIKENLLADEVENGNGDMSFEELLAIEKKDSAFWILKNGKQRSFSI